ncbi:FAD-dependent oxidoreductase [Streptomyces melanogenes]|uniref:FAD dependent oxidoreductase n=1 Tax=Streptomyces melanogenes TaxID=67326 RepID=A0ABZ1XBG0_9ACTN|nr:FAD-dependent oxidoreductase [Streptomyces melanogenes]
MAGLAGTGTSPCGYRRPAGGLHGTATFIVLNAVSSPPDDASFTAIAQTAAEYELACQETGPSDIPGYHPLDNDLALRACYLPEEGFIDARAWLATLDAALATLPNVIRAPAGTLRALPTYGYLIDSPTGVFRAPRAVVAASAWTSPLHDASDPKLPVVPVLAAAGTALTVTAPEPLPAVIRTPNRAYACGLHTVPQADGSRYIGARRTSPPFPTRRADRSSQNMPPPIWTATSPTSHSSSAVVSTSPIPGCAR